MTYMVLLLRHSDKIIRGRTGPTRERDTQNAPATDLNNRGSRGVGRSLRAIAQASLSLFARGPAGDFAITGSRVQKRFHGQAPPQPDSGGPAARTTPVLFDRSVGGAGIAAGVRALQRPWLNPDVSTNCLAKLIICQIVMCRKKCHKYIAGWCRSREALAGQRSS
jgi:hypothetical protein